MGWLVLLVYLVLGAANLYWGDLNQDEGWYLYAARQVAKGNLPYRDFAFTQGPLMPVFYALAEPVVHAWGVRGGRAFTFGLGFLGSLLAAVLAGRTVSKDRRGYAALVALILVGINVYHAYFTTIVKTYALCSLFLVGGLLALSFVQRERRMGAAAVSGLLLAVATGVRVSAGVALPIVGGYLLLERQRVGRRAWLVFGIGGAAGLVATFIPFILMAPEGFWFGMAEFHSLRKAGSFLQQMVYKAGFLSRCIQAYFVPFVAWVALLTLQAVVPRPAPPSTSEAFPAPMGRLLWAVALGVTFVHFTAPFPYDDYQVFVAPVFASALAGAWARRFDGLGSVVANGVGGSAWKTAFVVILFAASVAAAISSTINQDWFVRGRDRIWWRLKEEPAVTQLDRVATRIRQMTEPGDTLFTQDTYLAVAARRAVPHGLEMGPFSYFPHMSTERAARLHVLNRERMIELLRTMESPVAALSGYSLTIASPAVEPLPEPAQRELREILLQRYELIDTVESFGQAHTTLRIYRKRPEETGARP